MANRPRDRAEVLPALAEVFREHGFAGASLSLISEKTGLGKGSLYHFFPGGKEEMAAAVLAEIGDWFERRIFAPLREEEPHAALDHMLTAVDDYFRSGRRLCLVGVIAVGDSRDLFAQEVATYFNSWTRAVAAALMRAGYDATAADALAEESIAAIQGALVMARALPDNGSFARALARLRARLLPAEAIPCRSGR